MDKKYDIPELVDLPIYRDDYISQQQVNLLCRILWDENPSFVRDLISDERNGSRGNPNKIFAMRKLFGNICLFFRRIEKDSPNIDKISYVGMVDLVYEVERRIRKAIGVSDFSPIGQPIASSPEGSFPESGDMFFYILKDEDEYKERFDGSGDPRQKNYPQWNRIYQQLCKEHPEVVFAFAEGIRRYQSGNEANWFIDRYYEEHLLKD